MNEVSEGPSEVASTSSNVLSKDWHKNLLDPWENMLEAEQNEIKSKMFRLAFEEHSAHSGSDIYRESGSVRARIQRLLYPDYSVLGVTRQHICGLAEIEEGSHKGKLAVFHSGEISLFGHSGDFVSLVRNLDVVNGIPVEAKTKELRDLGLIFIPGIMNVGDGQRERSRELLEWLQERDLEFVDFVSRLSSESTKKPVCHKVILLFSFIHIY